jgi:TRAP-type C4-dicarboxylate transport system substrate-binding protein
MPYAISRRAFGASAAACLATTMATPFIRRAAAAAPLQLRCSLDTAPSHPRNVAFRDFLGKIEAASNGQVTTKLFESGSLFPDLQVVKALVQGQVEMACPGTWTITGFVADADFSQLPAFYGRPIDIVHKATDGKGGKFVNAEISKKLRIQVLGGWFDLGFNNWYSTRKALNALADLKDMKLRSPGGVLNSWRIRYFGGIPNVTAWPDVPLAMSQGTFDGLISTNESTSSAKLYDSGMHHSLQDNQGMGLYVPLVNQAFWAKLGPKLQETVMQLWGENLPAWRANTARSQAHAREELTAHGVTFVDLPQGDLDAVHAKMLGVQSKAVEDAHISPELVKLVMADVGA